MSIRTVGEDEEVFLVKMSVADIEAFLAREFPQIAASGDFTMLETGPMSGKLRLNCREHHLRPGRTVSGPTMFALADVGIWLAVLAQIGPVGMAVTTNLNINFLRMPGSVDLIADCRILKLGKRLAVGECAIVPAAGGELVAHATATYSIPNFR
ncbi:MAG: hypothetical protein RL735_629 [Pseudomonadota bacterium]|jgi:uncharacterized protein (TIGR00369 family)